MFPMKKARQLPLYAVLLVAGNTRPMITENARKADAVAAPLSWQKNGRIYIYLSIYSQGSWKFCCWPACPGMLSNRPQTPRVAIYTLQECILSTLYTVIILFIKELFIGKLILNYVRSEVGKAFGNVPLHTMWPLWTTFFLAWGLKHKAMPGECVRDRPF